MQNKNRFKILLSIVFLCLVVVGVFIFNKNSTFGYRGVEVNNSASGIYSEDTASSSGDNGFLNISKREDIPSETTSSDGDYQPVKSDEFGALWVRELYIQDAWDNTNDIVASVNKPLAVSTYTPSLFSNLGANATLNVKAAAGNVYAVKVHNINASARYIQLHNTATTPGGGAVPLITALVPASSELLLGREFFGDSGIHFNTGIAFAFSTTEATYTAGTATDQMTFVVYK